MGGFTHSPQLQEGFLNRTKGKRSTRLSVFGCGVCFFFFLNYFFFSFFFSSSIFVSFLIFLLFSSFSSSFPQPFSFLSFFLFLLFFFSFIFLLPQQSQNTQKQEEHTQSGAARWPLCSRWGDMRGVNPQPSARTPWDGPLPGGAAWQGPTLLFSRRIGDMIKGDRALKGFD